MRVLRAQDVGKVLQKGGPARVNEPVSPRFRPGDRVHT
ncbi:MAG: nitrile hydratase subunit beta, partial [Candidatus Rokubacteria bacterium]|nr:nitrile hydratase subunit beta [Candidatus Rokubacteria bacterium]